MTRRVALALLLWAAANGPVAAQNLGAIASVGLETDADHFSAARVRAGALFDYASPWRYLGAAAQNTTYAQSGWRENAAGVVALWRDQARDTLTGISAELGVVSIAGRTRPVADVTWSLRPDRGTGVELLAAAGLVETQQAIEEGIGYSFFGASVEHVVIARLTGILLAGYQPFTDGNARTHVRARLVFDALPDDGVNLQARWRQYTSSKADVGGAYFNPDRYQQWLGLVGFRKRVAGWTANGAVGAGQEFIHDDGNTTQPTYLAELRLEGPIAGDARLAVQAVYNRSAGFASSSDYWWGLLNVSLIMPF